MRWTDFTQGSWETAAHGILYSYNLKMVKIGRECEEAICKIYKMQSLWTFNIGVVGIQQLFQEGVSSLKKRVTLEGSASVTCVCTL